MLRSKQSTVSTALVRPMGTVKTRMTNTSWLPDESTAPVVQRIFDQAANQGDSARKIASDLNADGVIPPLKYRVMYRDKFTPGAARASDLWNYTTVKRILKSKVYLGHTILGKSRKVSLKSKKKVPVPKDDWAVTMNTSTLGFSGNLRKSPKKPWPRCKELSAV